MGLFNDLFAFIKDEETIEDSVLNNNTIQNQAKAKDTSPNSEKCGIPAVAKQCLLQEEPSEEAGAGAAVCRWRSCGRWEHGHHFRTFTSQRMFLIMCEF